MFELLIEGAMVAITALIIGVAISLILDKE